jgi:CRP-like cAMP-binding protein
MIDTESLTNYPIFKGIEKSKLVDIVKYLTIRHFKAGDYIIKEGTHGASLFLLAVGQVKITKRLTLAIEGLSSEEKQLASVRADMHPAFGENGLVTAGKRTANVIAITDCVLYELQKADFEKLVDQDFELGYHMMRNTCVALSGLLAGMDDNLLKFATALSIAVQSP